jgi:hypothetical protein
MCVSGLPEFVDNCGVGDQHHIFYLFTESINDENLVV